MTTIRSNSDPSDPRPWFDLRFGSAGWVDVLEANGLAAAGWTNADEQAEQALKDNSRHSFNPATDEEHLLAVDLEGNLVLEPRSEHAGTYYAHLGRYDPAAGEWLEKLRFTE